MNAKKRLKNEKESYNDRLENTYNAVLNSSYSLKKTFYKMNTNNKKKSKLLKDKLKGNDVLWLIIAVFAIILSIKTEVSLTSTLFPICIPWMEFETTLLFLMCILFLLQNYKAKRKGGEEEYNYSWIFKTILWLIIIPASVALPNRYIPISNTRIHTGKVVDKTRSKMPTKTTGGWQNYVKIKIDGEDTYFWYNLWNETKNDGAKCILYERKGIWGLSYVTNVNFIVE